MVNLSQKQLFMVLTAVALTVLDGHAGGTPVEMRTFTDTQGRQIDGHLLAFDAASQIVTIKRADGRTGKLALSTLAEADRLIIQDWSYREAFLNGLTLTTELTSTNIPAIAAGISDRSRKVFDAVYEIELSNPTAYSFEKLDLEYCIFYRQGERNGIVVKYDEGICYNKQRVAVIKPKDKISLETTKVRLYTESGSQTLFGQTSVSDAGIRGIWMKLKAKLPSGEEIVREYRTSDDKYWKWTPGTVGVGMNGGVSLRDFSYNAPL